MLVFNVHLTSFLVQCGVHFSQQAIKTGLKMVFVRENGRDKPVSAKFTVMVLQMVLVRKGISLISGTWNG
jgi:hypothetical protein